MTSLCRSIAVLGFLLAVSTELSAQSPAPTKTPRRRGLSVLEGSIPAAPAPATEQSAVPPPSGAPAPAGIDAEIASLKAKLAEARQRTIETLEPLSLEEARDRAAAYRRNVDRIRRLLYVSDPKPDGPTATALGKIQRDWGDLARPIIDGELPSDPLSQARWAKYAASFDSSCANQTGPLGRGKDVPLRGWAWSCLSDAFFRQFAEIEARVEHALTSTRRRATEELERRMRTVEERLSLAGEDMSSVSSPRNLSWLLHEVWVEGAAIRIRELEIQRAAGPASPAFRWFLDMTPVVRRPATGSRPVAADAGTPLRVKSGNTAAEAQVIPRRVTLSQRLHQAHYRLATVERRVDQQIADELSEYRRTVSDAQELEARAADLRGKRSERIEGARQSLERARAEIVAALAEEAR